MSSPTRLVFYQHEPHQMADVNDYTNRAVVTPQAALAYRGTLQGDCICEPLEEHYGAATRFIPMQDFHELSSKFLIQLALFDCETVTLTAASSRFPRGVILAARREKKALKELLESEEAIREATGQLIRGNEAWIVSVFEVWMAIH
ncbi:hypothetical protein FPRO05_14248 [Fusarium proliferatum]|uniref:Uncharacterized protein n=1 Tax=Gibberella intermedia TaxID=948311 RepID=A0A365MTF1_GIBIN|nr:hypothetical protein FPRO05_14248 [Fusarium proliferatum]